MGRKITLTLLIFLFFPLLTLAATATQTLPKKTATLSLEKITETNSQLKVKIIVNPGGQAINAVGAYLAFSKDKLQVIDLNTDKSFCLFFPENNFDNKTGKITIGCGLPNPGISTKKEIFEVTFKKIKTGQPEINFLSESMILANDGLGTDVLATTTIAL